MSNSAKTFRLARRAANGRLELFESTTPGAIGGHRRLRIFGRLDCSSAARHIEAGNYVGHRVFFADAEAAKDAGFRPCARCMPEAYASWRAQQG